jgi:hypothetical protein
MPICRQTSQPALLREHSLSRVAMQVEVEWQTLLLPLLHKTLTRVIAQLLQEFLAARIPAYHQGAL